MMTKIGKINQVAIEHEPCGCPACDDGAQPGHFACSQASEDMLQLERERRVTRVYDDGRWQWIAL